MTNQLTTKYKIGDIVKCSNQQANVIDINVNARGVLRYQLNFADEFVGWFFESEIKEKL